MLTLCAAVTNAASSVLQRRSHSEQVRQEVHGLRGLIAAVRSPLWLGGVALLPISAVLGAAALGTGQVSVVQSVQCLELPMVLVLSSLAFGHRLGGRAWTSIAVMAAGMALWLFSMHPSPGHPADVSAVAWVAGAGGAGLLVVLLAVAGWHGGRAGRIRRAQLLGVASGMSFALAAVFISADLAQGLSWAILLRWQTYAVVASAVAAMLLLQWGMQAGTLVAVQPGVTLADPVLAITLGVVLFHARIRGGWWLIPEVIAGAAIAYETLALSRSPLIGEKLERSRHDQPAEPAPPARSDPARSDPAPPRPLRLSRHRRRHPTLGAVLHWALLLGALAYAGYQAPKLFRSVQDGGRWLSQLRWGWVGVALVLVLLSIAAYAELQRRLLLVGGAHVSGRSVQAVTFASNAVANTVPVVGGAAAIAYAISRFHRRGADPALASWAALLAGLVSTLCLVILGAAGLALAGTVPIGPAFGVAVATGLLSILGWQLVSHPAVLGRVLTPFLRLVRRAPASCEPCRAGWADNLARTVSDVTGRIALLRPGALRWLWIVGLAAVSWGLDFAALGASAYAVLGSVPWAAVVEGFLVVQASIALQVLPGGAGLAEVGLVGIFATSTSVGAAAVVVVVYRTVSWLLPSVLGWVVYALQIHTLGPASDRHGPAVTGPETQPIAA